MEKIINTMGLDIFDMTDDELYEYMDELPELELNDQYSPLRNMSDLEMDILL